MTAYIYVFNRGCSVSFRQVVCMHQRTDEGEMVQFTKCALRLC